MLRKYLHKCISLAQFRIVVADMSKFSKKLLLFSLAHSPRRSCKKTFANVLIETRFERFYNFFLHF